MFLVPHSHHTKVLVHPMSGRLRAQHQVQVPTVGPREGTPAPNAESSPPGDRAEG